MKGKWKDKVALYWIDWKDSSLFPESGYQLLRSEDSKANSSLDTWIIFDKLLILKEKGWSMKMFFSTIDVYKSLICRAPLLDWPWMSLASPRSQISSGGNSLECKMYEQLYGSSKKDQGHICQFNFFTLTSYRWIGFSWNSCKQLEAFQRQTFSCGFSRIWNLERMLKEGSEIHKSFVSNSNITGSAKAEHEEGVK